MSKTQALKSQLQQAYLNQDFTSFTESIEKIRQLAKTGHTDAQVIFIDWYRQLNPAFDRIMHQGDYHPKIFSLRFKPEFFQRLLH